MVCGGHVRRSTGDERAVTGADRVDVHTVTCRVAENLLVGSDLMMSTASRDAGVAVRRLRWPQQAPPGHGSRHPRRGRTPDVVPLPTGREVSRRRSLADTW